MEQSVNYQLLFALSALLAGAVLALLYDLLKALRLLLKRGLFTALCDVLICITGLFVLFVLSMTAGGGRVRIYSFICCASGFILYFLVLGNHGTRFFMALFTRLAAPLLLLWRKFSLIAKKGFQISSEWFRMKFNSGSVCADAQKNAMHSEGEFTHEAKKDQSVNKNRNSCVGGLCRHKSGVAKASNLPGSGKAR